MPCPYADFVDGRCTDPATTPVRAGPVKGQLCARHAWALVAALAGAHIERRGVS